MATIRCFSQIGWVLVWLRDVPFNVPSFGDAGQVFDPFVYLGFLAGQTEHIALGVASLILPLRHPAQVAKAAATADQLSGGRLILGIASGDRPDEYPALNETYENRGERFRDSFEYIREMAHSTPAFENRYGQTNGEMDMLPKPTAGEIPMLITGGSQQTPQWGARHTDGLITYPRNIDDQANAVRSWRESIPSGTGFSKPVMQSLYIDLLADPDAPPQPIHLGFRSGMNFLKAYLRSLEEIGVNHVALNLRFNQADIEETLLYLAEDLLPEFPE
ncbi:TIGR03571 family LLM class oxidoreductase [Marinobacter adhaerens]|uniref:TIGR03571 family LLM class oxidoreductase n=1 Tax=Marinobacter adhaerens TaxID=1033846 RepID=UPI003BABFF14